MANKETNIASAMIKSLISQTDRFLVFKVLQGQIILFGSLQGKPSHDKVIYDFRQMMKN
jgi:hypothetical protein